MSARLAPLGIALTVIGFAAPLHAAPKAEVAPAEVAVDVPEPDAATAVTTDESTPGPVAPRPVVRRPPPPPPSFPPIAFGQTIAETVAPTEGCAPDPRARYYQFTAAANTRVEITMRSASFDPLLEIGRMEGCTFHSIARNDDGSRPNDGNNSRLTGTLREAGTYVVKAQRYGSDAMSGRFQLRMEQLPPLPPASAATSARTTALRPDQRVTASFTTSDPSIASETQNSDDTFSDPSSSGRPYQLYTLTGRAGQKFEISMDARNLDSFLEIGSVTPFGYSAIASDDDGGEGLNSRLVFTFPVNATAVIRASPRARGTGQYSIIARDISGE